MFIYFKNTEVFYDVLINHKSQAYINLKSMAYGRYVQWDDFC